MRGLSEQAHCPGYNRNSYSIACEGNYQVEKDMPMAQYTAVVNRIKQLKPTFPNFKAVVGHWEKHTTSCPGKYFPLDKIKMAISTNMPVLKRGAVGEPVKYLQVQLTRLGYACMADGYFGPATESAVRKFQQDKGLGVDGIVGTFTWSALNS
jgi:N-acetyl-anhydromuramyl-L-alanine amidase AmpD